MKSARPEEALSLSRRRLEGRALRIALTAILAVVSIPAAAQDRQVVEASEPSSLAVTVYRDPNRSPGQEMNRDWPEGFAMISETRTVTLPRGESTIRFDGVAEGMVAISAIVTGLPGGTIEKNRNADLLSPAALVDGTLGNRVRITRTNPGTGAAESESAIIRTRADGGLVLQTGEGYEAVRCSGLPERLTFPDVPDGLSAQPVFSIDTRDEMGGTYEVVLTYLAWGFDWQANYVATLHEGSGGGDVMLGLVSWLTILNDNRQSFENAELMAVAGRLNVVSDYEDLADPPTARPLRLTCYPLGSSLAGSPLPGTQQQRIVVTARRRAEGTPMPAPMAMMADGAVAESELVMAGEEDLGDLKLYRVPQPVSVNAQGLKQVAFLDRGQVEGRLLYQAACGPGWEGSLHGAEMLFLTVNDDSHGLGVALPAGAIALFEPSPAGDLLVGEQDLRDHASGQDVEIVLGQSSQVFTRCEQLPVGEPKDERSSKWQMTLTNANPHPVTVRLRLGSPADWQVEGRRTRLHDGEQVVELQVPANGQRIVDWGLRYALES